MSEYKLTTVCCAAALALVLTACSSSDNDTAAAPEPEPTQPEPMEPEPMEPEPMEPTDLETAQADAMAAAAAAKMASDNAAAAADDAEAAITNLATMQTGAKAMMYAMAARDSADMAMAAYMDAKMASDAAAAATDAQAATRALVMAEAAQESAEGHEEMAVEQGDSAMEAAMMELMIDGTMKSVGETTIDAKAPRSEVTSGSGDDEQKTLTGLIRMPMTTGPATLGRAAVAAVITTDPPTKYVSPMVNAEARDDLEIGKVVDSADDMARLQIITAYASTQSVRVYASDGGADWQSNKAGTVVINSDGTADDDGVPDGEGATADVVATLRPVGMFYRADDNTTDTNPGTTNTLTASDPTGDPPTTPAGDTVTSGTKAMQVYSFVNTEATDDPTVYVVLEDTVETTVSGEDPATAYDYSAVTVHVAINRDGVDGDENVFVTAALPAAEDYDHVHFGVWAGLGEADKDGSQKIADTGIGFVQSIGDGMTGADMPNNGSASYTGNWAGTVQESHPDGEGAITLTHDDATISANFSKGEITAMLMNLATLKGDISGSTFSGDEASGLSGMHGLDTEAAFTGEFSGGFYGEKAAEAAGIFSFSSKDNEGGAFVGAFGGAQDE